MKASIYRVQQSKVIALLSTFLLLFFPAFVFAQTDLVVCTDECEFADLIKLANVVIKFLMFQIATPLAAIGFAVAGWKLMTSGGDSGAKTEAKRIGMNVLIGFGIAMSAWLVVDTIFDALLKPEIQTFTLAFVPTSTLAPAISSTWEILTTLVS